MELTSVDKDDANDSLLVIIRELLYKNQLLREAIASKDDVIDIIIDHLTIEAQLHCSCGVAEQLRCIRDLVEEQKVELARRGHNYKKLEVDTYGLRVFEKRYAS
jgi:hypothetical protein